MFLIMLTNIFNRMLTHY